MTALRLAALNGLLAAAYALLGYGVATLRIEAAYPFAFWPPAGLALAAVLLWGRRALPGVALGAALLHAWLRLQAGDPPGLVAGRTALSALAAAAQAGLGAWLVVRWLGPRPALARGREVLAFWLFGGVAPTWIAPLAAGLWLFALGQASAAELARSLPVWWLGGALGVTIVAPIALSLAMPAEGAWRHRRWAVAPALIAATLGLVALFGLVIDEPGAVHTDFIWRAGELRIWALFTGGLVLCALVGALLLQLTARSAAVRQLVAERTVELERANAQLAREIAERRETETRLKRAMAEAAAADLAKAEFLGTVSHELRTPLNGVIGMTELLADTALDAEQQGYLRLARDSARRLLELIEQVLDFAKLSVGAVHAEAKPFRLRAQLAACLAGIAERARAKGLHFEWSVAADVPDALIGDAARLRQILLLLADNALKFTPAGRIEVRVMCAGAGRLRVEVRDTGVGIARERLDAIFDPFVQGDGSTTRRYGGTGMGLSLCRQLLGLIGGELEVSSQVGQGSCFGFSVPLRAEQPAPAATPRAVQAQASGALVVADTLAARRFLSEVLERQGWAVVTAAGPAEGLAQLDGGEPYRLLLLDLDEGVEAAFRMVRALEALRLETPPAVMIFTEAGMRGDAARSRALGVSAYLTKPVGPAELFEAVVAMLAEPSETLLITRHSLRERHEGATVLLAWSDLYGAHELAGALAGRGVRVTVVADAEALRLRVGVRALEALVLDWDATALEPERALALLAGRRSRPRVIAVAAEPEARPEVDLWLQAPIGAQALADAVLAALPGRDRASAAR